MNESIAKGWSIPMTGAPAGRCSEHIPDRENDDLALVHRVVAKDREAFRLLYERYAARLMRFLHKLLKRRELVKEALNGVMFILWQKAIHFAPTRASLSTWLFGIAHKEALKTLARSAAEGAARYPADFDGADDEQHEESLDMDDPSVTVLGWELGEALEQLSPAHRAIIDLTFAEGFSYAEIATIVGCPESTVKTRMFYARRRLAELLSHLQLDSR